MTGTHRKGSSEEKPEKRRTYGRIDLAVATLMAIGSMKCNKPALELAAMIA